MNDDKALEEDNISHLNGLHYYFHLLLAVTRQRKSRKREGEKKLNQKQTQDRLLPPLLNCRCGENDYLDNRQKIFSFPKRFPLLLEDDKNCNAYCKIFYKCLRMPCFSTKKWVWCTTKTIRRNFNINNRCLSLYVCCDCSLKNNVVAIPKHPISRRQLLPPLLFQY